MGSAEFQLSKHKVQINVERGKMKTFGIGYLKLDLIFGF